MTDQPDISSELIGRAMKPRLEFGRGILTELSREWGEFLVLTMPEVWEKAKGMLAGKPAHVHFVESMDRELVERVEKELPETATIVGIGGGASLDMAKYAGWKRGIDPVLVPGIASADACVTNTIAVRDDKKVRYLGFTVPKVVISDFELMSSAPPHLNRAGVGDILSIHTGSFDWKLAAERGEVGFDREVASGVKKLVDELEALAGEVRDVTGEALKFLILAYAAENTLCLKVGHSRPEEGSEHFFAYNVEHRTGKSFAHGELVCLGVLIMSRLQENRPERVEKILADTSVRFQPRDLGLTRDEVESALLTLPEYVKNEGLFHTIINERHLDQDHIDEILEGLEY